MSDQKEEWSFDGREVDCIAKFACQKEQDVLFWLYKRGYLADNSRRNVRAIRPNGILINARTAATCTL